MEPVTHLLVGLTVARAGAGRMAPSATAAIALGSLLPDIDAVYTYGGVPTVFQFHQGWTHSLVGAAALGAVLALPFWHHARQRKRHSRLFLSLLLAAWIGLASHLLLDWTTAAGVRLFYFFGKSWYALDWFANVDPWVLGVLLLGLLVPGLFRLISEEIGARSDVRGIRRGAWTGLGLLLILCLLRAPLHARALAHLEAQMYRGHTALSVGAFPTPANPFLWRGVVETDSSYELLEVRLAGPTRGTNLKFTYYKPSPSPAIAAARTSRLARTFLDWARFPLAAVEPIPNGHRVTLRDLRFAETERHIQAVWIELDANLQVVNAGFGRGE